MTRALVIVAHPDDETIWAGGLMLTHPDWEWHIHCLSRDWDSDRAPKFARVCEYLKAAGSIHGLIDEPLQTRQDIAQLASQIHSFVGDAHWDVVFFHGKNGEYGHIRHKECHAAVRALLADGRLKTTRAYCFAIKKNRDGFGVPATRGALEVRLSARELETKKFIIVSLYGFNSESFEARSCNAVERFRKIQ